MGLREQFAARQRPQEQFALRMDFGPEADAAEREHTRASAALAEATAAGAVDLKSLQRRVDETRAKREANYAFLTVQALPPSEFEDLISAHPATDEQVSKAEQRGERKPIWNHDTFVPALLAACIDSDMTVDDWAELIEKGPVASGEVGALLQAALNVNDHTPDASVGKG